MTFPSGPIVASIVTARDTRADCATSGYTGGTSLIFLGGWILPPMRSGAILALALAAASAFSLAATASAFSLPAAASAAALSPAALAATASSLVLSYDLKNLPSCAFSSASSAVRASWAAFSDSGAYWPARSASALSTAALAASTSALGGEEQPVTVIARPRAIAWNLTMTRMGGSPSSVVSP